MTDRNLNPTAQELRATWLQAQQVAINRRKEVNITARSSDLGAPVRVDGEADVRQLQFEADAALATYNDARETAAEVASDRLARTNTKLARVQTWLAVAIALATIAQAVAAIMGACHAQ